MGTRPPCPGSRSTAGTASSRTASPARARRFTKFTKPCCDGLQQSWTRASHVALPAAAAEHCRRAGRRRDLELVEAFAGRGLDAEGRGVAARVHRPALLAERAVGVPQGALPLLRRHPLLVGRPRCKQVTINASTAPHHCKTLVLFQHGKVAKRDKAASASSLQMRSWSDTDAGSALALVCLCRHSRSSAMGAAVGSVWSCRDRSRGSVCAASCHRK